MNATIDLGYGPQRFKGGRAAYATLCAALKVHDLVPAWVPFTINLPPVPPLPAGW